MNHRSRQLVVALWLAVAGALVGAPAALATPPEANGTIVFGSDATGHYQLYTVGPFGHGLRQLTHASGDALHPDWSPDGRRIAFELDARNRCWITLMAADGSHIHRLPHPPGGQCDQQPSFTPGGGRIVFESYNPTINDDAIWIENLNGSHQHRLGTGGASGATDPNVSPNGRWLTFVAFNGQDLGQGLILTTIEGTHPKLLLPYATDIAVKHDWAPNGRRIVFTNNADAPAAANIATIRPDGGVRWITHFHDPMRRAYVGFYSPDGRWIVYRLEDHGKYALVRVHPDGTDRRVILPLSDFRPRFIDWGPKAR